jgi:hypothetical protein
VNARNRQDVARTKLSKIDEGDDFGVRRNDRLDVRPAMISQNGHGNAMSVIRGVIRVHVETVGAIVDADESCGGQSGSRSRHPVVRTA